MISYIPGIIKSEKKKKRRNRTFKKYKKEYFTRIVNNVDESYLKQLDTVTNKTICN